MVFTSTIVVNGRCISIVVQTGISTKIGKIYSQIHEASQKDDDTLLKESGETLTNMIGITSTLVWLINVKYLLT